MVVDGSSNPTATHSGGIAPRRLGKANGEANELLGSAKQQVIGPARRPKRPVTGPPGYLSRGLICCGDGVMLLELEKKGCSSL
jgi:hypothetical protein